MKSAYIENFRIQKVHAPFLLKMMEDSEFRWWDDSDDSYQEINTYIVFLKERKQKTE